MELLRCPRLGDLTSPVQELQVAPAAPGLGHQTRDVQLAARRREPAHGGHEPGQVVKEVGEPEAQDGGEPGRREGRGKEIVLNQTDVRGEVVVAMTGGRRDALRRPFEHRPRQVQEHRWPP